MEHVIEYKIIDKKLKLWIYNDLSNGAYIKFIDVNDDFLGIKGKKLSIERVGDPKPSALKKIVAQQKVRDENGHFIKVITKDLNITSNGDML